jgi:hypothetical protein
LLVALILVAAAASFYLFREHSTADEELNGLRSRVALAEGDLDPVRQHRADREAELEAKQTALELMQENAKAEELDTMQKSFASEQDARDLMTNLIARTDESGLALGDITRSQGARSAAEIEFPSVSYSVVGTGPPAEFIGMLDIVWGVPTANVETLQLSRDPQEPDRWIMELKLVVVYAEGG